MRTIDGTLIEIKGKQQFDPMEDTVARELLHLTSSMAVFHFDLGDNHYLLPSVIKCIQNFGGKYSPFLDKNVSHLVTDKASTIAEAYGKAQKWHMKVWTFHQFLAGVDKVVELNSKLPPPSPTLRKAFTSRKQRDLSQYLEEEKKQQLKTGRAITPLYAAAGLNGGTAGNVNVSVTTNKLNIAPPIPTHTTNPKAPLTGKEPHYYVYKHPFVLIEEASYLYAPIQKEYVPTSSGRKTFPILYWDSLPLHCPYVPPQRLSAHQQSQHHHNHQPQQQLEIPNNQATINSHTTIPKELGVTGVGGETEPFQSLAPRPIICHNSKAAGPSILPAEKPTPLIDLTKLVNNGTSKPVLVPHRTTARTATLQLMSKNKPNTLRSSVTGNVGGTGTIAGVKGCGGDGGEGGGVGAGVNLPNTETCLGKRTASMAMEKLPSVPALRPKPGYCECCCEKYSDLEKHIHSEYHRRYAMDAENYSSVDQMIVEIKRPVCEQAYRTNPLRPRLEGDCGTSLTQYSIDKRMVMLSPARSTASGISIVKCIGEEGNDKDAGGKSGSITNGVPVTRDTLEQKEFIVAKSTLSGDLTTKAIMVQRGAPTKKIISLEKEMHNETMRKERINIDNEPKGRILIREPTTNRWKSKQDGKEEDLVDHLIIAKDGKLGSHNLGMPSRHRAETKSMAGGQMLHVQASKHQFSRGKGLLTSKMTTTTVLLGGGAEEEDENDDGPTLSSPIFKRRRSQRIGARTGLTSLINGAGT